MAICAGCDRVHPWGAAVIGFVAGLTVLAWSAILVKAQIDDPLDAVAGMLDICFLKGLC